MEPSDKSAQAAGRFLKAADVDPAYNRMLQTKAKQDIRNLVVAGLGVGAGARGLMGLYNMTRRALRPTPASMSPNVLTISVPTEEEEDEKVTKSATDGKPGTFSPASAESVEEIWWHPAGSVLGAGAGLYGGWKIVDSILDHRRRVQQEDELEKARQEFSTALRPTKQASELGSQLDALYDALQEKRASAGGRFGRKALAGYGVYAGLSSLLSGMWMYERARKRQRRVLLEAAKEKRLRQRFQQQPPRIMAIPREEEEVVQPASSIKLPDWLKFTSGDEPKMPEPKPAAVSA